MEDGSPKPIMIWAEREEGCDGEFDQAGITDEADYYNMAKSSDVHLRAARHFLVSPLHVTSARSICIVLSGQC